MPKRKVKYTVRDIDSNLDARLREEAGLKGMSLNQTILKTLDRGLGLGGNPVKRRDLSTIAGSLTKAQASTLESSSKEMRRINPNDWA